MGKAEERCRVDKPGLLPESVRENDNSRIPADKVACDSRLFYVFYVDCHRLFFLNFLLPYIIIY